TTYETETGMKIRRVIFQTTFNELLGYVTINNHESEEFKEEVIEANDRENSTKSSGFDWFKKKSNKQEEPHTSTSDIEEPEASEAYEHEDNIEQEEESKPQDKEESKFKKLMKSLFD